MKKKKTIVLATALLTTPIAVSADNYLSTTGGSYAKISDATTLQENDIIVIAALYKGSTDSVISVFNGNTDAASSVYTLSDYNTLSDLIAISEVNDDNYTYPREFAITNSSTSTVDYLTEGLSCYLMDKSSKYFYVTSTPALAYAESLSDAENWQLARYYREGVSVGYQGFTSVYCKKGSSKYYFIGGSKANGRFDLKDSYSSSNTSAFKPSQIYQKVYPLAVSSATYATLYFGSNDVRLPAGVKAYTYKYDSTENILQPDKELDGDNGDIIPHGTAVIVQAAEGSYNLPIMNQQTASLESALSGSDEAEVTSSSTSSSALYYSLSNGNNGIGFYWQSENGAAFTNGAHKAYLALDNASQAKSIRIVLPSGEVTGVEYIRESNDADQDGTDYYGLNGVKTASPKNGIYIKNGKKIVVK